MDKLLEWMRRIQLPPAREVANLDYWELLAETRIADGPGPGGIPLPSGAAAVDEDGRRKAQRRDDRQIT